MRFWIGSEVRVMELGFRFPDAGLCGDTGFVLTIGAGFGSAAVQTFAFEGGDV